MLKALKQRGLTAGKSAGVFRIVGDSKWRQQRLLILCYHGISLVDEHEWDPSLFMNPDELEERLELIRRHKCSVLPLGDAIERLYAGTLPARSVAITFDDGNYDFYRNAYPLLRAYGYPATVYLSTYHCDHQMPIFRLICSYMLWRRRGEVFRAHGLAGVNEPMDLRSAEGRARVLDALVARAAEHGLSAEEKNQLAADLAKQLCIDWDAVLAMRILQLMTPFEVGELARAGVDIQLHTHRHRSPRDRVLYKREIVDNRTRVQEITGTCPVHFCYPSGVYAPEFLPWLAEEGVRTATTCEVGLATRESNPLLLPRIVDHRGLSPVEFEGWLTGTSTFVPRRSGD